MPITQNPLHLSSLHDPMKQGIVSILSPDFDKTKTTSIRRTLSADMSSMKGLHKNGFKSSSFSLQGADQPGKSRKSDIISSYVHPLVKRSSSGLSEKSLEFCTENLGSETGSDGFCSESLSDSDIKELNPPPPPAAWKLPVRSFPPPLSSISGGDGPSLKMQSCRENGRLFLEAVFVPPRKIFHACRRDGRLVLSFVNSSGDDEEETEDGGGVPAEEKLEGGNVAKEVGFVMRGKKTEHFVPYLRGCNGPKWSLLIWEPCCIATS